jgi:hypothetical protein
MWVHSTQICLAETETRLILSLIFFTLQAARRDPFREKKVLVKKALTLHMCRI